MSKAERDAAINDLSGRLFASMLDDIVMDVVIQTQKEVRRSRNVCSICNTRCGQVHTLPTPAPVPGSSRAPSPPPDSTGNSTQSSSKGDGYLECVNCQKSLAYNRYAQHLAGCLGIGTGVRRTAQRNVVTKTKNGSDGRSSSPFVDDNQDTSKGTKLKGKLKEDNSIVGQKRPGTPQTSPAKKVKKGKASPLTSAATNRLPGSKLGFPGSKPKNPSNLRSTPTPSIASHISKNSLSPSANSDSSDAEGGDSGVESVQSSLMGGISPSLPAAGSIGRGRGSKTGSFSSVQGSVAKPKKGGNGTGPPVKKAQGGGPPAQPPAPRLPSLPPPAPVRRPESSFLIGGDDGQETGSDTD